MAVADGAPSRSDPPGPGWSGALTVLRVVLGVAWIAFQGYILVRPLPPLVERPVHLSLALVLLFLWRPVGRGRPWLLRVLADGGPVVAAAATGFYYVWSAGRLTERMEGIDPLLAGDVLFGILCVALLLEGVRRAVGWPLLGVLGAFLVYAMLGNLMPGWLGFSGFGLTEVVEILALSLNGVLGITTGTSVQFVFYFILFGAVYSSVGGSRLVIDLGLRVGGRSSGGPAKAAVVSSSLMGSITGSAVANVAGTGVFTIPLMRRAGYSRTEAGSLEAISSTGGQLMPPIMGVAAFVMAEMLQVEYARIALAGLVPALAFYAALFLSVDLGARRTGVGRLPADAVLEGKPILPRLHLLAPPLLLVGLLVAGYSATLAAVVASLACLPLGLVRWNAGSAGRRLVQVVETTSAQACQVAVPIAAVGIIIAVAVQSNLALKFSGELISGGSSMLAAVALIVVGCLVMGMGLPTVAAYLIGAVLFVPALKGLGFGDMPAHFFVMYYCVLSMVTPPVALASYAAAGIAGSSAMATSAQAFRLALVCFLIPFAFLFDPVLLGQGGLQATVLAGMSLLLGTAGWAVALTGYWLRPLRLPERALVGLAAAVAICVPTGTLPWFWSAAVLLAAGLWLAWTRNRGRVPASAGTSGP